MQSLAKKGSKEGGAPYAKGPGEGGAPYTKGPGEGGPQGGWCSLQYFQQLCPPCTLTKTTKALHPNNAFISICPILMQTVRKIWRVRNAPVDPALNLGSIRDQSCTINTYTHVTEKFPCKKFPVLNV